MIAYSVLILCVFISSFVIPIMIAAEHHKNNDLWQLDETPTDTFFMKG